MLTEPIAFFMFSSPLSDLKVPYARGTPARGVMGTEKAREKNLIFSSPAFPSSIVPQLALPQHARYEDDWHM